MRDTEAWKSIKVKESVWVRLLKERDSFEKIIGGGSWSVNDTIVEMFKILDSLED